MRFDELDDEGRKTLFWKMREILRRKYGKWDATDKDVIRFIELAEREGWSFEKDEVFPN